jgi:hypothetical protein
MGLWPYLGLLATVSVDVWQLGQHLRRTAERDELLRMAEVLSWTKVQFSLSPETVT